MSPIHQPVLLQACLDTLAIQPDGRYIDATVGSGGHTIGILNRRGVVLGIDRDPQALARAEQHIGAACPALTGAHPPRYQLVCGNFSHLTALATQHHFWPADGILADLGISSDQLDDPDRGLSFQQSGLLDMRLDQQADIPTAADIINTYSIKQLYEIFTQLADEKRARPLAQAVVNARSLIPLTTTKQLADVAVQVYGPGYQGRIHPATKLFQALRLAVNHELDNLVEFLPQAWESLNSGGRLAMITFHSGEDRIVKQFFQYQHQQRLGQKVTKKPLIPPAGELNHNPRARSAKLRVIEKLSI